MTGLIDTLYTPLGTTLNYRAIAGLHTLQFTVTHALGSQSSLVVSWQRIYNSLTVTSQSMSFLAITLQLPTQFNSSAPRLISWQAGISKLDSILFSTELSFIATLHGPRRKQPPYY
jgi:hypothetical protein